MLMDIQQQQQQQQQQSLNHILSGNFEAVSNLAIHIPDILQKQCSGCDSQPSVAIVIIINVNKLWRFLRPTNKKKHQQQIQNNNNKYKITTTMILPIFA